MSLLEQQLKELQTKKSKIEYFKMILSLIENPKHEEGLSEEALAARDEVTSELSEFIKVRVTAIENGQESPQLFTDANQAQASFTEEEVDVLKDLVARTLQRSAAPAAPAQQRQRRAPVNNGAFADDDDEMEEIQPQRPQTRRQNNPPPKRAANQDKISFAMAHRNLDGKRCTVPTKSGGQVGGKIVGTDAPYLVVQTDTGHTINVPPEDVEVG